MAHSVVDEIEMLFQTCWSSNVKFNKFCT